MDDNYASLWRKTQLKIYGVPLSGWGYEIFDMIGCMFRQVLPVHHVDFNCAKVLILTDCLFLINCKIAVDIMGHLSKVCVSEDYNYSLMNSRPLLVYHHINNVNTSFDDDEALHVRSLSFSGKELENQSFSSSKTPTKNYLEQFNNNNNDNSSKGPPSTCSQYFGTISSHK